MCVCVSEAETEGRRGTAAAAALQVSAVQTCLVSAVVSTPDLYNSSVDSDAGTALRLQLAAFRIRQFVEWFFVPFDTHFADFFPDEYAVW